MISFDTSGLERLAAELGKAPATAQRLMRAGVRDTAEAVLAEADRRVPVRTGALRQSLRVEYDGDLEATVSANTDYADYVEHGTSKMAPEPFMGPSFDARSGQLEAEAARVAEEIL